MKNNPKYSLFKNTVFALEGLYACWKNETSFKIEVVLFVVLTFFVWFLHFSFFSKMVLQISMFFPLIAELLNSAVESIVDLTTKEFSPLAKYAKDTAAAAVLLSFVVAAIIWITIFVYEIKL
jgi:diacylglycerol kinase (ATP)